MATIRQAAPLVTPSTQGPLARWGRLAGAAVAGAAAAVAVIVAASFVRGADDPDWQLTLESTEAAPDARASVDGWVHDAGTEMRFDITGLSPSGSGAHYEIWLTAPDGRHVAAGTFTSSGTVTGWSGVSRADFPRLWITLEPNDDDESLSGQTVLDTPRN